MGMEEYTKGILLALVMPSCFRAHRRIARNDWENNPQREECVEELNNLVRTHINTQHIIDFGIEKDAEIWENESWSTRFGIEKNQTPLAPEYRYMPAALLMADMIVAVLCRGHSKGLEDAESFTAMLANAHSDVKNYNDKAMVDMLGDYLGMDNFENC